MKTHKNLILKILYLLVFLYFIYIKDFFMIIVSSVFLFILYAPKIFNRKIQLPEFYESTSIILFFLIILFNYFDLVLLKYLSDIFLGFFIGIASLFLLLSIEQKSFSFKVTSLIVVLMYFTLFDFYNYPIFIGIGIIIFLIQNYFSFSKQEHNLIYLHLEKFKNKNRLFFSNKEEDIKQLIKKGETDEVEFKETLRTNLHTKQVDPKIEHAVLKSITGFLNSKGGILFVGVADDGALKGLDKDNFQNDDKLLLHLNNMLKNNLLVDNLKNIKYELVTIDGIKILKVTCVKSDDPVFLKAQEEEFYVRIGPSTNILKGSSLINYIKGNF